MSPFTPSRPRGPDLTHFLTNGNTIHSPNTSDSDTVAAPGVEGGAAAAAAVAAASRADDGDEQQDFDLALDEELRKYTNMNFVTTDFEGAAGAGDMFGDGGRGIDFTLPLSEQQQEGHGRNNTGGGGGQQKGQAGGNMEGFGNGNFPFAPPTSTTSTTSANPFDIPDFTHQQPYPYMPPHPSFVAPTNPNLTHRSSRSSSAGGGPPSALPSSSSADPSSAARAAAEEDKRRRNTAASARFRVKKKEREKALERTAEEHKNRVTELEGQVSRLKEENQWLKDLFMSRVKEGKKNNAAGGVGGEGKKRKVDEVLEGSSSDDGDVEGDGDGEEGDKALVNAVGSDTENGKAGTRSTGRVKRGVGTAVTVGKDEE